MRSGSAMFKALIRSAAIFASLALPAFGQSETSDDIVIRTLDVTTKIPAPPWTETAKIAATSETTRQKRLSDRGTDVFLKAYVPKGQTFEDWEEMFAVKAETPLQGNAQSHRDRVAKAYRAACVNAVLAPVVQKEDRQIFILFCPSYSDTPEVGEYSVMVHTKKAETLVEVFYSRRVPAYDLIEKGDYPSSKDDLRALVRHISKARILPREGA